MLQVRYLKFTYLVVAWILLESNDFEYWFLHKDKLFPSTILLQHNLFFSTDPVSDEVKLNKYLCLYKLISKYSIFNVKKRKTLDLNGSASKWIEIHFAAMLHIKWFYHCVDASACVFTGRQFDKGISATLFSIKIYFFIFWIISNIFTLQRHLLTSST